MNYRFFLRFNIDRNSFHTVGKRKAFLRCVQSCLFLRIDVDTNYFHTVGRFKDFFDVTSNVVLWGAMLTETLSTLLECEKLLSGVNFHVVLMVRH